MLVNYWIIPVSEENRLVIKEANLYGAPEATRSRHVRELVKPGDVAIFYVAKKNSKKLKG
jgi:predicted RNA-binding protein